MRNACIYVYVSTDWGSESVPATFKGAYKIEKEIEGRKGRNERKMKVEEKEIYGEREMKEIALER